MARAYKKTYLNGAMRNLAVMLDCGVRKYGYPIGEFYLKFLSCEVSRQFAAGNPRYRRFLRLRGEVYRRVLCRARRHGVSGVHRRNR